MAIFSKDHLSTFNIRGDSGVTNDPTAIHFVGDAIFIEGADQGPYSAVWVYKTDGTQVGPITSLGGKDPKPISTYHGSFSILDKDRVGLAERGMELLTTYEADSGKRRIAQESDHCRVDNVEEILRYHATDDGQGQAENRKVNESFFRG